LGEFYRDHNERLQSNWLGLRRRADSETGSRPAAG
jgi:hypothetical protein